MALSAAQTVTAMAAQPTVATTGGLRVTVDLLFDGKSFVPADLLTALLTQYGAGKVFADTDTTAEQVFRFRVIP